MDTVSGVSLLMSRTASGFVLPILFELSVKLEFFSTEALMNVIKRYEHNILLLTSIQLNLCKTHACHKIK